MKKKALKIPPLKIKKWTTKEMKLYDVEHLIKPLEGLEKKFKNKKLKSAVTVFKNFIANQDTKRVAGTIRFDEKTGKRFVVLNKDIYDKSNRFARRRTIAHEAFHAKAPFPFSYSEMAAHIYGGVKSKAGLFNKYGPIDQVKHYYKTRPVFSKIETAGILGTVGGGVYGGKKLLDKEDKKLTKKAQWSKPTSDFWNDVILQNIDYARYLAGHKANLGTAGVKIGLSPGKILAHDWSKLKPKKFDVYEDFFFGPEGRRGKLSKDVYTAFKKEVEDHYRTEAHHRHKLGLPEDPQTQMESVVDWYSTGKTNADMKGMEFPNFLEWWDARKYGFLVRGVITKDTFVKIEQAIAKNYNIVTYTIDKLRSLFK